MNDGTCARCLFHVRGTKGERDSFPGRKMHARCWARRLSRKVETASQDRTSRRGLYEGYLFSSDLFLFFLERDLVGALELKERTNFNVYSVMMMMMMMALITGKFDERD